MWYEKRYYEARKQWLVYECSPVRCVLIGTFKTEKGANNCIKRHGG